MNIIYQKETLYVFIKEPITKKLIDSLKYKVSYIVREYSIPNIVVNVDEISVLDDYLGTFMDEFNVEIRRRKTHQGLKYIST